MAREVDLGSVVGPQGPQGPAGPKGDPGMTIFQLQVDQDGNLYAIYPDGSVPPEFDYNTTTGDLYLVINDT